MTFAKYGNTTYSKEVEQIVGDISNLTMVNPNMPNDQQGIELKNKGDKGDTKAKLTEVKQKKSWGKNNDKGKGIVTPDLPNGDQSDP